MRVGRIVLGGIGLLVLAGGGAAAWGKLTADSKLSRTMDIHEHDFPIPFPLGETELAELRAQKLAEAAAAAPATDAAPPAPEADPLAGMDLDKIALERAVERGKHLVHSRYVCVECHAQDFGGGTMIDDPAIGRLLGANLTTGKGSRTLDYKAADWDRMVRHGVKPGGRVTVMPAEDFALMSDRELSDIVSYIRSMPPVDREQPAVSFGPVGTMLVATGQFTFPSDRIEHGRPHQAEAPEATASVEFGKHVAQTCMGCHNPEFSGGKIVGGDPSWVPARNLTPHADGLGGWTYEQFHTAVTTGKRPDGTDLQAPMSLVVPYLQKATDVELQALFMYLQSLPPKPTPKD
jgi:mono/diheme cytochrome c family protein